MYNRRNHFVRNKSRFSGNNNRNSRDILYAIQAGRREQQSSPKPVEVQAIHNNFTGFNISNRLKQNIAFKNYTVPTPIQDQAIIPILEGKDLIGIANTGTGKTAAFLIPLINKVMNNRQEKVLIITPVRELALQINDEFYSFTKGLGIYSTLCIGGTSMFRQRNELRKNANFIIGTPGRIKDMIQTRNLILSQFHTVVLDEADRMVDIGFIQDIKYFISLLPVDRQSLFFSATIGQKEREIIQKFVRNAVTISVKQQETSQNVTQDLIRVFDKAKKVDQLHDLLIQKDVQKALIFGRTKWGIQKLANELIARGFKAGAIHGNKTQFQRQRVLEQFKRDEINVLLATDVASRGLDIPNVSHVINYEIPATYEDYVHRIGRTGRANNRGIALTFVD